jgi:hypothetical protein
MPLLVAVQVGNLQVEFARHPGTADAEWLKAMPIGGHAAIAA